MVLARGAVHRRTEYQYTFSTEAGGGGSRKAER